MSFKGYVCECGECILGSTQAKFSVYGAKTSYVLENRNAKTVSKLIVDDCVLSSVQGSEKCDYLFVHEGGGCFVELKGGDVLKAISQLNSSIAHLRNRIEGAVFARIICSNFKKAPDIKGGSAYRTLMKLTKSNLIIKSGLITESV